MVAERDVLETDGASLKDEWGSGGLVLKEIKLMSDGKTEMLLAKLSLIP